ncbi:hypothetical protein STRTUCAR8_09932 [Streptomyces turgidiscabies Car8]|uniref:Uncharacterized protein n=1 Tax=Streptomyces turgidiscabies (strain Car8) TaxID=698760 RepID=L7EU05_STRT8|nr:hypothetical protein STRTUCAR8_09932 [Streptomyces turgidiscabies Car8]
MGSAALTDEVGSAAPVGAATAEVVPAANSSELAATTK